MAEGDIGNVHEVKTRVAVPDVRLVGYVIGKQGGTITGLMRETSTYIHYEKETNEFIIEGEPANQYSAKIKVKEILANGVKTPKYLKFPFINSNGQRYVLEPKSWDSPEFKVVLKGELKKLNIPATQYQDNFNLEKPCTISCLIQGIC